MADDEPDTQPDVATIIAAASAAAGRALTDPVVLAGGGRSSVLRCRAPDQTTAIVKTHPDNGEGRSSFAAEAAGLQVAGRTGLAPALLGVDCDLLVLVMSDLGPGGSLADALLGGSPSVARSALLSWARACGALSATAAGKQQEFDSLKAGYLRGHDDESYMAGLGDRILQAAGALDQIGVRAPEGLAADLAEVAAAVRSDRYAVFSPGDICPDNNMLSRDAIQFLDFESAGFHSAFLDAAYIRMPFSTCWCVFGLPAELAAAAEAAYRAAICAVRPELADDSLWQAGVRRGAAAWTLSSLSWLLRSALQGDEPTDPHAESPRTRQLIRYRWRTLARELEPARELPALAELMRSLLAATENWQAPGLPLYPAFR